MVGTDTRHETVANNYAEYLFEAGEGIAGSFTEYFETVGIGEDLPLMLCVEDLNDPGIGALCDGLESAYAGTVERLSTADYDDLRARLETRLLADEELGALFSTSGATADVYDQAEALRRCVADGAAGIATTLAEPEVLKPAVREAIDAGIPVLSFNSGAEVASGAGR